MPSFTSLSELVAGWAAANPRVQRVWLSAGDVDWYDPDKEVPPPSADGTTLVYQRAA